MEQCEMHPFQTHCCSGNRSFRHRGCEQRYLRDVDSDAGEANRRRLKWRRAPNFNVGIGLQHTQGLRPGENIAEMDELEEEIDTYSGGKIDLGELVAQQMGITIDPYPRKEGAALPKTEFGPKIEEPHPFADLTLAPKSPKDK